MSGILTKVRNGVLAASMLGALGFGASQALAAPAEAEKAAACSQNACNRQCEAQFGPFASGFCENGVCQCAV